MVNAKKYSFAEKLIFLYLVLFPFGQLIRVPLYLNEYSVVLHPVDLVTLICLLYYIFGKFEKSWLFISYFGLSLTLLFTWVLSFFIVDMENYLYGLMYIVRFVSYGGLLFLAFELVKTYPEKKKLLFNSLILVLIVTSILGWIQYLFYYDFRKFIVWGWDDHLFRMFGTFFDPGYFGLIITFGFLSALGIYLEKKNKNYLYLAIYFLITLGFTYSRASYTASVIGFIFIMLCYRKVKFIPIILGMLVLGVLLLPRPASSGVQLERLYSAISRIQNYIESITIIKKYPLFGIGYNNLCAFRKAFLSDNSFRSHSCSGADSSVLFILVTSGIVGFFVFVGFIKELYSHLRMNFESIILITSFISLLIHSMFHNSIFYPWILGWMLLLTGLCIGVTQKTSKQDFSR